MIELKNIKKIYKTGKIKYEALKDIDVVINDGEMVAILGKSGSGKTTLLNIIGLLDSFEDGEYFFNEVKVSDLSENQKAKLRNTDIGIVLQDYSLINHKTALFNTVLPLYFDNKAKYGEINKRGHEMLKMVGIEEQANKKAINMSGGQKQRIAIARAMINNPSVILADEPTGALDTKTTEEIMDIFKELNRQGKTVIIITHDNEVAMQCKRIIELSDGKIIKDTQS